MSQGKTVGLVARQHCIRHASLCTVVSSFVVSWLEVLLQGVAPCCVAVVTPVSRCVLSPAEALLQLMCCIDVITSHHVCRLESVW
jgi:hypothetical protein